LRKGSAPGRLVTTFLRFARMESSSSLLLLAAAIAAMALDNSAWAPLYESALHRALPGGHWTVHHAVNDGLMVLFFLTVGLDEVANPRLRRAI